MGSYRYSPYPKDRIQTAEGRVPSGFLYPDCQCQQEWMMSGWCKRLNTSTILESQSLESPSQRLICCSIMGAAASQVMPSSQVKSSQRNKSKKKSSQVKSSQSHPSMSSPRPAVTRTLKEQVWYICVVKFFRFLATTTTTTFFFMSIKSVPAGLNVRFFLHTSYIISARMTFLE